MPDFSSSSVPSDPISGSGADPVQALKEAAEARAREFGEAAGEKFREFREVADEVLGESREKWQEVGDQAMEYIKANPGKSVLAGLGAGFIIGLLFRDK